ncbi:MAG TPA: P-II family nitrogen regulator [Polyangiaceae bacterium]|nr:P-II family nitrogen regulator [Polyangiaceae bacterium]
MKLILAFIKPFKIDDVKRALSEVGVQGMSIAEIKGFGRTGGKTEVFRGSAYQVDFVPKLRLEIVVTESQVHPVLDALERSAKTGKIGDGKVFVLPVDEALRIRTGERGDTAL